MLVSQNRSDEKSDGGRRTQVGKDDQERLFYRN